MTVAILSSGIPSERYPLEGIFAFDQAKALHNAGIDVVFLSVDLRSIRRIRRWGYTHGTKEGIQWHNISIPVGPIDWVHKLISKSVVCDLYRRAFKDRRPDIIHTHFAASFGAILSQKYNIPLIITEHSSQMNRKDIPQVVINRKKKNYILAQKVVTVSNMLADNLCQIAGIHCRVIHNIIDTSLFSSFEQQEHASFTFVSTALLSERKRVHQVITALEHCPKDVKLIIVGDGPERQRLEQQIQEHNLQERVELKGLLSREETARVYSICDCFVLPSALETFGVVYVEAMASGLPVIATKCGGPEDFVTKETGVLVDVDDETQLSDAMNNMILHRKDYRHEEIKDYARNHFSPQVISAKLVNLYSEILG